MKPHIALTLIASAVALSAGSAYLYLQAANTSHSTSASGAESGYVPVPGLLVSPGQYQTFPVSDRSASTDVVFGLENNSSDPIDIHAVRTECNCIATHLPDRILPGDKVPLRISVKRFDTFDTEFASAVQINTNLGNFRLYFNAVLPEPRHVRFRPSALLVLPDQTTSVITAVFPSVARLEQDRDHIKVTTVKC